MENQLKALKYFLVLKCLSSQNQLHTHTHTHTQRERERERAFLRFPGVNKLTESSNYFKHDRKILTGPKLSTPSSLVKTIRTKCT